MKKTALVTGGSENDIAAMACLVLNIKETNPNLVDEIVIFHDGINKKDQKLMNSIFPTRFIKYKTPFKNIDSFDKKTVEYFSSFVYCKYECLRLLDQYKTVIWTDYDVLITGDLSELTETKDCELKLVQAGDTFKNQFFDTFDTSLYPHLDFNKEAITLPLFVLTDKIKNYMELYEYCINVTEKHGVHLKYPEQAGFQLMIEDKKINFEKIQPYSVYVCHPRDIEKHPENKIQHAYCQPKFWNGLHNEKWESLYNQWIKMGGCKHMSRFNKTDWLFYKIRRKLKKILGAFF